MADAPNDFGLPAPLPGAPVADPKMGFLGTLFDRFASGAKGTISNEQALSMGIPQARGLDMQQLQQLMGMPQRQAQAQEMQENIQTAPARRKKLEAEADLAEAKAHAVKDAGSKNPALSRLNQQQLMQWKKEIETKYEGKNGLMASMNPGYEEEHDADMNTLRQLNTKLADTLGLRPTTSKDKTANPSASTKGKGTGAKKIKLKDGKGNDLGSADDTEANRKLAKTRGYTIAEE